MKHDMIITTTGLSVPTFEELSIRPLESLWIDLNKLTTDGSAKVRQAANLMIETANFFGDQTITVDFIWQLYKDEVAESGLKS